MKPVSYTLFFEKNTFDVINTRDESKSHETIQNKYWKKNEQNKFVSIFQNVPFNLQMLLDQNNELLDLLFGKQKRFRSQHIPYACKKSNLDHIDEILKTIDYNELSMYEHSGLYKFRDIRSIAKFSLFKKYCEIYLFQSIENIYALHTLSIDDKTDKTNEIQQLLKITDTFLIIHNESKISNLIYKKNFQILIEILYKLFPLKSSFEI
jgi:hypothetical protein